MKALKCRTLASATYNQQHYSNISIKHQEHTRKRHYSTSSLILTLHFTISMILHCIITVTIMIRHTFPTKTAYGCFPLLYGYHSGMSRRTDKEEGQATIANKDKQK